MPAYGQGITDALADWGRNHPVVGAVLRNLPLLTDDSAAPGLHADASRAPWSTAQGEVRVSLVRVLSVPHEGARPVLVGQVQAMEFTFGNVPCRRVGLLAHGGRSAFPVELDDVESWWMRVLDRHYALGGPPVTAAVTPHPLCRR